MTRKRVSSWAVALLAVQQLSAPAEAQSNNLAYSRSAPYYSCEKGACRSTTRSFSSNMAIVTDADESQRVISMQNKFRA